MITLFEKPKKEPKPKKPKAIKEKEKANVFTIRYGEFYPFKN